MKKLLILLYLLYSFTYLYADDNKAISGDYIIINFSQDSKINGKYSVTEEGTINVPVIGTIEVKNLDRQEIIKILQNNLKHFYYNPKVNIEIFKIHKKQNIYFKYNNKITKLSLDTDDLSDVFVKQNISLENKENKSIELYRNEKKILVYKLKHSVQDFLYLKKIKIKNNDLIVIIQNNQKNVIISGELKKTGIYEVYKNTENTLEYFIKKAGFFKDTSDRNNIVLIRNNEQYILNYDFDKKFKIIKGDKIIVKENSNTKKIFVIGLTNSNGKYNITKNTKLIDFLLDLKKKNIKDNIYQGSLKIYSSNQPDITILLSELFMDNNISNIVLKNNDVLYFIPLLKNRKMTGKIMLWTEDNNFTNVFAYANYRLINLILSNSFTNIDSLIKYKIIAIKDDNKPCFYNLRKYIFENDNTQNPELTGIKSIFIKKDTDDVLITGAVLKNGYYKIEPDESLFTVLLKCGGTKKNADLTKVLYISNNIIKQINLKKYNPLKIKSKFELIYIPTLD